MKNLVVLGMGLCMIFALSSCKSSESAYKKAYEKAKQQELIEAPATNVEATPVVAAPVMTAPAPTTQSELPAVRKEKVELVSGDGLQTYSVVCGSFSIKANAEGLRDYLNGQGYSSIIVYNSEKNTYRVISESFDNYDAAAQARDNFKAKYPNRSDFQTSWLLYKID